MSQLVRSAAVAAPEEARSRYVYENTKATLSVVQFRPSDYRSRIVLSSEDLARYAVRLAAASRPDTVSRLKSA